MARAIALAHRKGFRVGVVLLACVDHWTGPEPTGAGRRTFSPGDTAKLRERLDVIRVEVRRLRDADVFAFIPGDPGGDPGGRSTVHDCVDLSRRVREIVRQESPRAAFVVNLWGIAEWEGFPSPFGLRFWQQEARLSRVAATAPELLGPDCGAAFPLHGYYRPLTLACYAKAALPPELYPAREDILELRSRGARPLVGWPYFVVDEVDEGYMTPNNAETRGQMSAETRYIRAIVDRARTLGLDGLVGNAIFFKDEALNIYAFGRMCRDPNLTADQAIDGFAGLVAQEQGRVALGRVLRFVENRSNWQATMPMASRQADFHVPGLATASEALALLRQVRPRVQTAIALPEEPALYLSRVRKRLEAIEAGRIGGARALQP